MTTGKQKPSVKDNGELLLRDFPGQITTIRHLCKVDETLAEICRDYEEIAILMARGKSVEGGSRNPTLENLAETLAGLRAEIVEILARRQSD